MQFIRACPVCFDDRYTRSFRSSQSPGPISSCTGCGFVFVNPIETSKALIQEGPVLGDYPPTLLESSNIEDIQGCWEQPIIESYIRELPAKKINAVDALEHISSFTANKGRLLDIGCFCGVFLSTAAGAGWDCYGIEPLVAPSIYARATFDLPVITDTLRENSYPKDFFDVVTTFQVFEHLIHPDQEIEVIHHILKPGGLLVIEVPNIDTLAVKIMAGRHRHFTQDHISLFSARTLQVLLERYGFRVKEVYYPSRVMSFQHFSNWIRAYNRRAGDLLLNQIPKQILDWTFGISLRDIVTVISEKNP
jgi:2-polyprenyl-3-methyl-5-hydroxy-6-metoxy-1,4-benzoquinol methylase